MGTKTKALSVDREALVRLGERAVSKHSNRVATQHLAEVSMHCSNAVRGRTRLTGNKLGLSHPSIAGKRLHSTRPYGLQRRDSQHALCKTHYQMGQKATLPLLQCPGVIQLSVSMFSSLAGR